MIVAAGLPSNRWHGKKLVLLAACHGLKYEPLRLLARAALSLLSVIVTCRGLCLDTMGWGGETRDSASFATAS